MIPFFFHPCSPNFFYSQSGESSLFGQALGCPDPWGWIAGRDKTGKTGVLSQFSLVANPFLQSQTTQSSISLPAVTSLTLPMNINIFVLLCVGKRSWISRETLRVYLCDSSWGFRPVHYVWPPGKYALYQYRFINKLSFEGWITARHYVPQHTLVQRACQQLKLTKDDYYVWTEENC